VVSEAEILLSGRSGWHKERRIPLSIKLGYTIFLAVWIPAYWQAYGWENFLWICDVANLLIGLALWLESPILIAAQAVGVLIIQALWLIDVLARLLIGFHPIGGTEYMFDATKPLFLRLLSLFHVCVPVLLLWAIARLGYDRRGWRLQAAFTALLLPTTFLLTDPADNINWIWRSPDSRGAPHLVPTCRHTPAPDTPELKGRRVGGPAPEAATCNMKRKDSGVSPERCG
jgi:hypothetical protein